MEHTYPNAGYSYDRSQLFLWEFEASGHKYVKIDRTAEEVVLYNLDHTFFKSFSFADHPSTVMVATFLYMSEHLFDLDDGIEYMYFTWDGASPSYLRVYDEDGSVHLNMDGGFVYVYSTLHNQQYPIYNSPEGTKLVVSMGDEQSARVYSLPGTLSPDFASTVQNGHAMALSSFMSYPNPVLCGSMVDVVLPQGVHRGRLELFNGVGQLVREVPFDGAGDRVRLDTSMLPAGTYVHQLRVDRLLTGTPRTLILQ